MISKQQKWFSTYMIHSLEDVNSLHESSLILKLSIDHSLTTFSESKVTKLKLFIEELRMYQYLDSF
jgi:hypothetical protein